MNYFTEKEINCRCGCGKTLDKDFLDKLNKARERADIPFVINSGARCEEYNKKVGGVKNSDHLYGCAVDIAYTNNRAFYRIVKSCIDEGIDRFVFYKGFVHCGLSKHNIGEIMQVKD